MKVYKGSVEFYCIKLSSAMKFWSAAVHESQTQLSD